MWLVEELRGKGCTSSNTPEFWEWLAWSLSLCINPWMSLERFTRLGYCGFWHGSNNISILRCYSASYYRSDQRASYFWIKKKQVLKRGHFYGDLMGWTPLPDIGHVKTMKKFRFCHIRCRRTCTISFPTTRCIASATNSQGWTYFLPIKTAFFRYSLRSQSSFPSVCVLLDCSRRVVGRQIFTYLWSWWWDQTMDQRFHLGAEIGCHCFLRLDRTSPG